MKKTVISTNSAPEAIGAYSQAIKAGNIIFISGQIPLIPETGKIIQGDIKSQTRQILENINNILKATGTSLEKVVKTTIFMKDLNNYSAINSIYHEFFPHEPPARAAVEVSRLPKDAEVEIEAIAILNEHGG